MYADSFSDCQKAGFTAAGVLAGGTLLYQVNKWRNAQRRKAVQVRIRQQRDTEVEALRQETRAAGVSPDNEIVQFSLEQLTQRLQSGELKAVDVLKAYQAKAVQVHDRTNCLTGRILEAEERAELLDRQEGEKGPLHGVPVSLKENVALKGYVSTWGCVTRAGVTSMGDADMVKLLLEAGAVPFVRTNIPQTMLAHDSANDIFGTTTNFHDTTRCAGGSSGGEGALIAGHGSIMGLGSDIGGSIRCPASFSGIYGLKPGTARFPNKMPGPSRGQTVVVSTFGPLTRDVETLVAMMKTFNTPTTYQLNPLMPPLPFRDDIYKSRKPLRIGWFVDDGHYPAVPAMVRAVNVAKDALEKAGHTLVPWQPPAIDFVRYCFFRACSGDGGKRYRDMLVDDDVNFTIKFFASFLFASPVARRIKSLYYRLMGKPKLAQAMDDFGGFDAVYKWHDFTSATEGFRKDVCDAWEKNELDAVLCPSLTFPAPKTGSSEQILCTGNYMYLFNVLDFPAGTLPVTKVTKEDVSALSGYSTGDYLTEWVRKDQAESEGLPVCVQVASLRWQEELVLRVMKELQDEVNYAQ